MIKVRNKVGFHCGPGGNPSGIGTWMRTLNAAGIAFSLKSVDHFGMLHEATTQIGEWQAQHTLVYRLSTKGQNDGFDYDTPDMHMQPESSADRHYDRIAAKLPPEMNRTLVWHEPVNEVRFEPDPGDPMWGDLHPGEWYGRFAIQYATRCLLDNMRCALFGYASGNPERECWAQPSMVNFLRMCAQHPDQVAIALHEYSYDVNNILHGAPHLIGRFQLLFDVCDSHDIPRPTVLITEWGWTHNDVPAPDTAVDDIDTVMQDFYAAHPQIKMVALWYLGAGFSSIANKAQKIIAPLTQHTLDTEYEVDDPPPVTPPPGTPPQPIVLSNASFEEDWSSGGTHDVMIIDAHGSTRIEQRGNIFTPPGWGTYFHHYGDLHQPEVRDARHRDPDRMYEGEKGLLLFGMFRRVKPGLYKIVSGLMPGATYQAKIMAHAWSNHFGPGFPHPDDPRWSEGAGYEPFAMPQGTPGLSDELINATFTAGADPGGGTNPTAPTVVWGQGWHIYNKFAPIAVEFTAVTPQATLFFQAEAAWPFKHNDFYFDFASLEVVSLPMCPGQAREPYNREYWIVSASLDLAVREAIYLQAAREGRTIGPSFDDAGVGDNLLSKHAVPWETPVGERQGIVSWFEVEYPGTAVTFRYLDPNTPSAPFPPAPIPPDRQCPGQARTPYNREYWVVPGDLELSKREAIYLRAARENKTVGPSFDDAGVGGNLRSKLAHIWEIPPDQHPLFITWFATHYPDTAVQFRELPKSGWDSPVGWDGNWAGEQVWPPYFIEATPIGKLYTYGDPPRQARHTGSDLNDNETHGWDSDRLAPMYAPADGVIIHAGQLPGTWGNVIVIDHGPVGPFEIVCSRYAHLHEMNVQTGQAVVKGQQIGRIGNAGGQVPFHLHFDVSPNDLLLTAPGDWPGTNFERVVRNYLEPRSFIRLSRPGVVWPTPEAGTVRGNAYCRTGPGTNFAVYRTLTANTAVTLLNTLDGWYLLRLATGEYGWCHGSLISSTPPQTGNAGVGLHASADPGDLHGGEAEYAEFRALQPGVIKVLSAHSQAAINRLATENPGCKWIIRAFLQWGGRSVTPQQFYDWTVSDTQRAVNALIARGIPINDIWIELHNEPNLVQEGWTLSWADGAAFAAWLTAVHDHYKAAMPNVKYLYPGLSPGGNAPGERQDAAVFLQASLSSVARLDGMGIHAYWSNPFPMAQALAHVDATLAAAGTKPAWITEASRNDRPAAVSNEQYAQEYSQFVGHMQARPRVLGVTYFAASASNSTFHPECWVVNGRSKGIGQQVKVLLAA